MLDRDLQSFYNRLLVVVNNSALKVNELSISLNKYDMTTDVVLYATFNINIIYIRSAEYVKKFSMHLKKKIV